MYQSLNYYYETASHLTDTAGKRTIKDIFSAIRTTFAVLTCHVRCHAMKSWRSRKEHNPNDLQGGGDNHQRTGNNIKEYLPTTKRADGS